MTAGWVARIAHRAGPLAGAAGALGRELPRGTDGIRRLADAVEAFAARADATEDDDRAFVESAAAALALLLIDHAGDGAHAAQDGVHRVRLGPHGFFDPFAAIDEALDADRPRASLAASVARAEAEARGEGPIARVVIALLAARPDLVVTHHFEHVLRFEGGVEIDIGRVVAATCDRPEGVSSAVERLVAALPGGAADPRPALTWDEARPRLLPRLVGDVFLESLPERAPLALAPVAGDVRCALVVAYEGRARFVRNDELAGWSIPFEAARTHAIVNLEARSLGTRFLADGALQVARSGDGLDAARLLLPALHDALAPRLGSPFLVAVPHRDVLIASPIAAADALAARARDDAARAPHRISDTLLLVGGTGLAAR
jgi:uncharacterized protein YtpQ (UPF0354 family)